MFSTFALLAVPALAADYAAWASKNPAGAWTKAAEAAVAETSLPKASPADVAMFCPNYKLLDFTERTQFWVGLLSAVAHPESGFNPTARHVERIADKYENPVVSRGLLQLSLGTAKSPVLGCAVSDAADLEKPETNLACGARLLANLVKRDGLISNQGGRLGKGGSSAWPVLRHQSNRFPAITRFTRQLPVCVSAR